MNLTSIHRWNHLKALFFLCSTHSSLLSTPVKCQLWTLFTKIRQQQFLVLSRFERLAQVMHLCSRVTETDERILLKLGKKSREWQMPRLKHDKLPLWYCFPVKNVGIKQITIGITVLFEPESYLTITELKLCDAFVSHGNKLQADFFFSACYHSLPFKRIRTW